MAKQDEATTTSIIVIPATKQQKELFELPFQMSEEERKLNPPERAEITDEQKASIPDVISGYSLTAEDKRHLLLDALIISENLHYSIDDKNQIIKNFNDGENWVELPVDQKNVSFLEQSPKAEKSGKKALFEKVAEDLIKRLEEGTAPWQKPWGESGIPLLPYNPTTGKNYKGLNTFALMMAGRQDPRWLTFNQAVANKWTVKRGEKGSLINFYKFDWQEAVRDEKGKPVLDEQGKQKYKTIKLDKPIIVSTYVFNAEQVEGIPKLEITAPENNWKAIEAVEQILKNSGAVIRNVPGDDAFYSPIQDYIQMPLKEQFPDAGLYYATALHELGHWTGHEDRLNRPILNQFGTEAYAKEELRAEIGSYMLGMDLQIGHDPSRHAAYVANWITVLKNDPFEIHRAAADAQKIYDMAKGFEQKLVLDNTLNPENQPNTKSMKNDINSENLQSTPQKNIAEVGLKTETSQSFTISRYNSNATVHLESDDLKVINSIIDKLNDFKKEGFEYISVEKADYKYNTYNDAEYYNVESTNDVFYLANGKNEIREKLDLFKLEANSEYNSTDNNKTVTSFKSETIDDLIDSLQSKQIFLPREEYHVSLDPTEIKNFSNLVNIAVDVNKVDVNKVVYRQELTAPDIPERLKIGDNEVTLTPQQRNDLEFGVANIGKLGKYENDIQLFTDPEDKNIIRVKDAYPVGFAEPIGLNQPEKTIVNGENIPATNVGRKANFALNEVIKYKESGFEVMALLKQGSLRMKNQSTDQVFILKTTDNLYGNLLKAKSQPLSEAITIKDPTKSENSAINSAFEMKGAEFESIQQRQSGFKR